MPNLKTLLLAVAALALLGGCSETTSNPTSTASPSNPPGAAPAGNLPDLVDQLGPSVVTVTVANRLGSGVVLKPDIIVTNRHVVADQKQVSITYADGTQSPGTVLATDQITDLAVIRTDRKNLPVPKLRTDLPRPGEPVLAIGSPLGFENTVTSGIISGLHRDVPGSAAQSASLVDLIQTDAAISPGNSGGALLDTSGQLIGINEAYLPPSTGAVSIGFAIPAATMVDTTDQLLKSGVAKHPYLGISIGRLTPAIQQRLDVQVDQGALVLGVDPHGPADAAGIRAGDVIVKFAGRAVRSVDDLLTELRAHDPGAQADLEVVRGSNHQQATVTIGSRTG
ncbi:trypsin-like peptidase domain-containing protein [Amycolatopsis sp. NPDC051371]|uniref:S1C family serine protease n=1 Tax=Amycolatopsis sp. NPDC051371 TaxID=3155800 RepID=UPI003422B320